MNIFTAAFWSYAGERALKTVAQTAISLLTVGGIAGVLDVAWVPLASATGLAGVISVLTSIVAFTPTAKAGAVIYNINTPPAPVDPAVPAAPAGE